MLLPPGGVIWAGSPTRLTCELECALFQVYNELHKHTTLRLIIFVTILLFGIYILDYNTAIRHHILYLGRTSKIHLHTTGTAAALFQILFCFSAFYSSLLIVLDASCHRQYLPLVFFFFFLKNPSIIEALHRQDSKDVRALK